jgi:hypothetical protein
MSMQDTNVFASCSAASLKVYLPDAVIQKNAEFSIKLIGSNTNTVTVYPSGSQTIEEGATVVLNQRNEAITVVSNGSSWWIF